MAAEGVGGVKLRVACRCGGTAGRIDVRSGQNCVFCESCGRYAGYNAPKSETGEQQRRVSSRADMKPSQRSRIFERDGGRCCVCGRSGTETMLHVGHVLSVADGTALGATVAELSSDENLVTMCEECNLGQGRRSLPPRMALLLVRAACRTPDAQQDPNP